MSRYRVVLLLATVALIGSLSTGREIWWSMLGALLALIIVAQVWSALGIRKILIERRALTRVAQAGQTLEEEFRLTNLSRMPKLWVEVKDLSTLPRHFASRVISAVRGKQWRGWRTSTFCTERGRFTLGPMVIKTGDPLGIYSRSRSIEDSSSIIVYPAVFELRDFPLPAGYLPGGDALRRRTHYITTNAAGVRDYVPGDTLNRIHWPITVKRQKLTVKEFELDPMAELYLMLDLQREVQIDMRVTEEIDEYSDALAHLKGKPRFDLPKSTEEYGVSLAATIIRHFLNRGRAIGFVTYAQHREVQSCDTGDRQLNKIMEMLAVLRAQGSVPFDRVLRAEAAQLPRGATVIAISPSVSPQWSLAVQQLVRSGQRVVAIVLDPVSFGGSTPCEGMVASLAEAGAVVRVIRYGDMFSAALERAAVV